MNITRRQQGVLNTIFLREYPGEYQRKCAPKTAPELIKLGLVEERTVTRVFLTRKGRKALEASRTWWLN